MAFIGNSVQTQGFTPAIDYFSGNGSTVTFTLSRPVASVAQMIVAIDNVIQNPSSAFTVSGNAITFSSAPLSGTNNIWVEYTSLITTYNGISQSPSVIGDITATGGYLASGSFNNTFLDGTIVDYVTGNGRVTVGPADGFTLYNGGTTARNTLLALNTNGALGVGSSPSYGTAGQILQSNGSSTAPSWTNIISQTVNYLIVGGGGGTPGSDNTPTGGGGGGGFLAGSTGILQNVAYTITVGAGGTGSAAYVNAAASGGNSVAFNLTALGGGKGAWDFTTGTFGGSGGGGSGTGGLGTGTPGQGYPGGNGAFTGGNQTTGGGGGAGGAGVSGIGSSGVAGAGGIGAISAISGSNVYYGGGGGGGSWVGSAAGGTGGGGSGNGGGSGGANGTANTGGGAGGAGANGSGGAGTTGFNGGSGVVIVSYPTSFRLATATGTYTQTSSGGNYIFTFTGSGTITF